MPEYTLKVRRYKPETERGPAVLGGLPGRPRPDLSVLDGLLQVQGPQDGSLVVRCSCRAAICGSCGIKINGESTLACKTQIGEAQAERQRRAGATARRGRADRGGADGNMPVIKDLVTDMESTHWTKIRRVTPWLLDEGEPPEREYVVVARVDDRHHADDAVHPVRRLRLGLPVDGGRPRLHRPGGARQGLPVRRRPARRRRPGSASTTSPRTRTGSTTARTASRASTPAPRASRRWTRSCGCAGCATHEEDIDDQNNGRRHEAAFAKIIQKKGTLDESLLLQESYAAGVKGKLIPRDGRRSRACSGRSRPRSAGSGRQDALAAEADPRRASQAARRRPGPGQGDLRARRGALAGSSTSTSRDDEEIARPRPSRRREPSRDEEECDALKARLLAGLRLARLHDRAARLDGAGRRAARDRARDARPRQLLRRRGDRRAQPGAGRHAERAHLRARPADGPRDDEHLLHLPGRAVGVPAAPRRRRRLPRPHQRGARRGGPRVREGQGGLHEQELPLAPGRGLRPRDS